MKILLLILVVLVSLNLNSKRTIENFVGNNDTTYYLKDTSLNNLDRVLSDKKTRQEFEQIQREFPLTTRDPLSQSNVSQTPQNETLLKKRGVPEKLIDQNVPVVARRNLGGLSDRKEPLFKENKKRIPTFTPEPVNETYNGSKNFIDVGLGPFSSNLLKAFNKLKREKGISDSELIGVEWQEINRLNFVKGTEIKSVINQFLKDLNNEIDGEFTYLDKEDARIEKSFPITSDSSTNLGKEYTKYTIIFYIQDQNALTNRGIKGIFIKNNTNSNNPLENGLFAGKGIKYNSLEIVGEKGDLTKGPSPTKEYYQFGGNSREEQKITQYTINKELEKTNLKRKTPEYFCFGSNLSLSENDRQKCITSGGFYDTPVKVNEECPYYLANKNYLNSRGGSRGGFCELPLGLNLKGFRKVDPNPANKPLCYNCIDNKGFYGFKTLGDCCEEQAVNRVKYPTLKSPDYAFPSDIHDRAARRKELHTLDLSWNRRGFSFEDSELPKGSSQEYKTFDLRLPSTSLGNELNETIQWKVVN